MSIYLIVLGVPRPGAVGGGGGYFCLYNNPAMLKVDSAIGCACVGAYFAA